MGKSATNTWCTDFLVRDRVGWDDNMKLLEVPEGKWGAIRKKMTRRLLEEQDKVLRSYFAQRYDQGAGRGGDKGRTMKPREQEHLGHDVYA